VSVQSRPHARQTDPFLPTCDPRALDIFSGLKYLTICLELDILSRLEYRTRSGLNYSLGGLGVRSLAYSYVERRANGFQGVFKRFNGITSVVSWGGILGVMLGLLRFAGVIYRVVSTLLVVISCNVIASIRQIVLR
jgi:hypothetical protein